MFQNVNVTVQRITKMLETKKLNCFVLKIRHTVTYYCTVCDPYFWAFTFWNLYAMWRSHIYVTLVLWNCYAMKLLCYGTLTICDSTIKWLFWLLTVFLFLLFFLGVRDIKWGVYCPLTRKMREIWKVGMNLLGT